MNDEKIMPNPQFPYEETLKYIKLAQSGDREAMNELVERNMALVRSIEEIPQPGHRVRRFVSDRQHGPCEGYKKL